MFQIRAAGDHRQLIAAFPKGSAALFAPVVLAGEFARGLLHQMRDLLRALRPNNQVNMVAGDGS